MEINTLTVMGEVVLVPILTFLTIWVRSYNDKELRRDKRDDGYIKSLEDRITALEARLDKKETDIREINLELKNRDAEYLKIYQEHTTLKAKYEVLQNDYDLLKKNYITMTDEMFLLKETLKKDRENTASLAANTAQKVINP